MALNQPNAVLGSLLAELGWSPHTLAQRINKEFGSGTVAGTAAYHWRDSGGVPRQPLPQLVAWLLSHELDRVITVEQLWQGKTTSSPLVQPADARMDLPWARAATLGIINDWVASGLLDRRHFLTASSGALTAVASGYLTAEAGSLTCAVNGGGVGHPLLEQIENSIPLLQRLDDSAGGGAHLAYVGAQFRAVALVLRQGGHTGRIEQRLFAALTELGQLAGWMAFDAGEHGLAQRYFFTALRAAREADYRSMAAHVLADLAFQAASRQQPTDAVGLGEAAKQAATHVPATVRASVSTRLAYGYAVAGNFGAFDRCYQEGQDFLTRRRDDEPAWMYFLTPRHLDTQAGYALVHAAALASDARSRKAVRPLLRRGERLLATGAHDYPLDRSASQRRALFEGAWLAVAATCRGDLERACTIGRVAVARTENVQSARSIEVLRVLSTRLKRSTRNAYVADFVPILDAAVARQQTRI